jgi:hypothetical protein
MPAEGRELWALMLTAAISTPPAPRGRGAVQGRDRGGEDALGEIAPAGPVDAGRSARAPRGGTVM